MTETSEDRVSKDVISLYESLKNKKYSDAEKILSEYANPDDLLNHNFVNIFTPLSMIASGTMEGSEIDWLINHGANVDFRKGTWQGALNRAIEEINIVAVAKLIEHGVDVNSNSLEVDCPIFRLIDVRAEDGASPDRINEDCQQILKLLINYGAEVNSKDWSGHTPLTKSLYYFDKVNGFCQAGDLIPILLAAKADPLPRNGSGFTALEIALRNQDAVNINLLQEYTKGN